MFKLKYNYVTNTSDEPYIQYWFAKKLEGIAGSTVTGEGSDFNIVSPTERSLKEVVLKGDTTQETLSGKNLISLNLVSPSIQTPLVIDSQTANSVSISIPSEASANFLAVRYTITLADLGLSVGDTCSLSADFSGTYVPHTGSGYGASIRVSKDGSGDAGAIITTIRDNTTEHSFVIPADTTSLGFFFYICQGFHAEGDATATFSNIQLEKGSTVTSFEPYCGGIPSPNPDYPQTVNTVTGDQTITIAKGSDVQTYSLTLGDLELCKIGDYQDSIYKDGEKWYVHKSVEKLILTGSTSENWSVNNSSGSQNCIYCTSAVIDNLSESVVRQDFAKCNYFSNAGKTVFSSITDDISEFNIGTGSSRLRFLVRKEIATNKTTWDTWLASNTPSVYYALDTPTDTEITDETLLGQLNTILSDGYLSAGTNTVQTSATGLPIIINIKA